MSSRRLARATTADADRRRPARPAPVALPSNKPSQDSLKATKPLNVISPGTPLSHILHVSQLGLFDDMGTHEEFVDRDGDLQADDRTTFDARGGSYDIAIGRTGS